jgi:CheY-like chemotaxis protein
VADNLFSIFKTARILGVYPSTVEVWVKEGKLRTADDGSSIYLEDLNAFLDEYNMPVPRDLKTGIRPVILVVDDDDMVRSSLTNLLRRFCPEAEVVTASGGFEAGQMVSVHVPDLVLLDIMLPGIDGFQACRMIKDQYNDVKILAITGYGSTENRDRIIDSGADGFLTKPVGAEELLENVKSLLGLD